MNLPLRWINSSFCPTSASTDAVSSAYLTPSVFRSQHVSRPQRSVQTRACATETRIRWRVPAKLFVLPRSPVHTPGSFHVRTAPNLCDNGSWPSLRCRRVCEGGAFKSRLSCITGLTFERADHHVKDTFLVIFASVPHVLLLKSLLNGWLMNYFLKKGITVTWADLSQHCSLILVGKNVCFVSRPTEIATFPWNNDVLPNWVVDFIRETISSNKK